MAVLSLVEVQNLTCERGGRRIFRDISFAAASGQVLTLEGPNGAGKSSALRILADSLQVDAVEARQQLLDAAAKAGLAVRELARTIIALHTRREGSGTESPRGCPGPACPDSKAPR